MYLLPCTVFYQRNHSQNFCSYLSYLFYIEIFNEIEILETDFSGSFQLIRFELFQIAESTDKKKNNFKETY